MFTGEILVAISVIIVMILLYTKDALLMPMNVNTMLTSAFIATFLAFLALFWREEIKDERDKVHSLQAGKISFYIGAIVIFAGIITQSFRGEIDPWLLAALSAMILAKVISRIYSGIKQ